MTVSKQSWPHIGLFILCALTAPLAVFAPRGLALLPGLFGLLGVVVLVLQRSFSISHLLRQRPVRWIIVLAIGLPALAALSSYWSIAPDTTLERAQKIALVLVPSIGFMAYLCAAPIAVMKRYMWLIPLGLITGMALNIFEIYSGGTIYRYLRGMDSLTSYEMAAFNRGVVAQMFLLIPAIFIVRKLPLRKMLRGGFIAVLVILALFILNKTDSQSSQVAFALAAIIALCFPYKWRSAYPITIMALIVMLLLAPFMVQIVFYEFGEQFANIAWLKNGYAQQRLEIWDMVARYALKNPLYGHGIEATKMVPAFDTQMLHFRYRRVLHPHNFALQIWMEFGVIGILLMASGIAAFIRHISFSTLSIQRMALASFFAVIAVSATGYGMWQSWWLGLLVLLAGFCVIVNRISSER